MGSFFTNFHARSMDQDAVVRAVRYAGAVPAYVSASGGGWISVYPEPAESQDEALIQKIAQTLSTALHQAVFAFLVHDSDIFAYWLYDQGKKSDVYDSAPGFFEGKALKPKGGKPAMLLRYCMPGTSEEQLKKLLHDKQVSGVKSSAAFGPEEWEKSMDSALQNIRDMYPKAVALNPNFPPLEEILARTRKYLESMQLQISGEGGGVTLADDLAEALGRFLGLPDGRAGGSYKYFKRGEVQEPLVHVD